MVIDIEFRINHLALKTDQFILINLSIVMFDHL